MEVLVALDQGSSSSRAVLFDLKGKRLSKRQFPLRTFYRAAGFSEHDPDEIYSSQRKALEGLLSGLGKRRRPVAIGMAGQRSTVVFWDRKTGRPAGRALSWQDGRASKQTEELLSKKEEIHEKTGLYLTPYYSAPKIRWAIDNWASVRRLLDAGRLLAGPVTTYVLWNLTRGEIFRVDPTLAQRSLLMNVRTLDWDENLLSWFGIPRECLPEIFPTSGDWGSFRWKGRSIPITASIGDQQSTIFGLGVRERSVAALNYGTGAFFLLNTGADLSRVPGLLSSVAWKRKDGTVTYHLEGTVHAAGTSFEWLRTGFGMLRNTGEVNKMCSRSRHRLWALPAIGGLGAPRWDYKTLTAVFGLTTQTSREDIVRAFAEGIAFLISDIASALREKGFDMREVRASGGLSKADYLVQFQSSLLQMPILRFEEVEVTALGAAALAAEGAGVPLAKHFGLGRPERIFKPKISAADSARLMEGWQKFVESTQNLSEDLRKTG